MTDIVDNSTRLPLAVIDDDPTGAQLLTGIRVLMRWSPASVMRALTESPSVHLITNSRAVDGPAAQTLVRNTTSVVHDADNSADVVLRGDSTLRAHLIDEYTGARETLFGSEPPVHLLVPALPQAGRITIDTEHLLVGPDGSRQPLSITEYARDAGFSYRSSNLLEWAQERSNGFFAAGDGSGLVLGAVRGPGGAAEVAELLCRLSDRGRPCVCAPDAETIADVQVIAAGYRLARRSGARVLARSAPALVGVLSDSLATGLVALEPADSGLLVVVGSYVPTTTRQLEALQMAHADLTVIEIDVAALDARGEAEAEVERVASAAATDLAATGLAVVATPRERRASLATLETGDRIARGLAAVVARIDPRPDVIVAKGGITSAVVLRDGLEVDQAEVRGPILPGVSLWEAPECPAYVVVPGNVGPDNLLVELVERCAPTALGR